MRLLSFLSDESLGDGLRFPAWLAWFVPEGLDEEPRRRARTLALTTALSAAGLAVLAAAFAVSGTPAQTAQAAGSAALLGLALLVLRRGETEAAAWITALTLAATAVAQAALDAGVRDPVLALIATAPIVAAMTSGLRLAVLSAALGSAGAAVLLGVHLAGGTVPVSSPESVAWYSFGLAALGAFSAAILGAIYVHHTRRAVGEAETRAAALNSALHLSEARYRSLADGLPLGLFRTTPEGRVLYANQALADTLGAPTVEAARDVNAVSLYTDPARRADFEAAVRRDGAVRGFEAEWKTPTGQVRQVRIDARMERTADAVVYEGAVEDVTAERRARAATARSEARFRALVQRSSDLVIVIGPDGRLSYVSPAVRAFLGREPDVLLGRDPVALVHPDDRGAAVARLAEATDREDRETTPVDLRLHHADGHYVYAEGVAAALYHDPAVNGLVLNFRDVTERKRAQAVLVQAKKQAEEVAHLKSTFLANMSHEIRTPLTAILGFSDVLADEITDPQQKEFVDLIARAGKRLMDTLNSVLDLARLEAGRGDLACTPLRVGEAAEEAVLLMASAAADRGLTLAARVEAPQATALLDDAAFARVLHNLVGNALKFTEAGGVTIRVAQGTGPHAGRVVVEVADTGMGIDPDFLPRLFGEFEQASAGLERTHEGAGLGLAISRQLVERMEGTISVESTPGEGTTFTLSFPSLRAEAPETGRRPSVLVVDDNEQALVVAERVLASRYNVCTAATGAEALDRARADRPDAVLLDIHLGDDASGEDVLRALRAEPTLAGLPVVAVTAYGLPGDRARLLALGFDDYVTKPYTRERLLSAIGASLAPRAAVEA